LEVAARCSRIEFSTRDSTITYGKRQSVFFALLLFCAIGAHAQADFPSLTANNTSACPSVGKLPSHCQKPFSGHTDTRQQVATPLFDAPAGNVSDEDLHSYLAQGATTKIFANVMPGFCTNSEERRCHNNVQTGYTSDDQKTVAAQAEDMRRRHIDGAVMVWQGAGTGEDGAALKLQSYLNANHCSGPQKCDLMYVVMYDGPTTKYTVSATGIPGTTNKGCAGKSGADYENCVIAHIRNDMCYLNGHHWGNDAYQKVNGRPLVMIFPDEDIIPAVGSAPSWTDVWVHIKDWNNNLPTNCTKPPYNADNGVPLIIFENEVGLSHAASSGSYYWLKPAGTDPARDQFVQNIGPKTNQGTLDYFYEAAAQHKDALVWGSAFKGFNSSKSPWSPDRIMDQQCGQVWLSSIGEANKYYTDRPLPFLQIATWNDYNEGTEIESGIDNCYTVTARVDNDNLIWNLNSTKSEFASLSTVSHVEIYDAKKGHELMLLANVPPAINGTYPLASLSRGKHELYVRMVGKNSILNRISPGVEISKRPGDIY
jgi:hypothetical protein